MLKQDLINKVNNLYDSNDIETKRLIQSDIQDFTRKNKIFKSRIYTNSFITIIRAHIDAYRLSKTKTSKNKIIEFIERHYNDLNKCDLAE
jgi:hypothetical protein